MTSFLLFTTALLCCLSINIQATENPRSTEMIEQIRSNRDNPKKLAKLLPIVKCSFTPTKYEDILMTKLRDVKTKMQDFRSASDKLSGLLVAKVIEILPVSDTEIETPIKKCQGKRIEQKINLVSIMRSGDAILESFVTHFPRATISKILIQRNEETALPEFKYMKLASTLGPDSYVVITEPMVATGGTLSMVINLLKEKGVPEEHIIIASFITAPEGLLHLSRYFPKISVVMAVMDDSLNAKKFIVPGLGDFGDRYFGTNHNE